MYLQVKFDAREVNAWLTRQMTKQLPFATSKALNDTAYQAQAEVRRSLGEEFVLRNRWTAGGIQVERSSKRNLKAVVGVANDYLLLHETGGTKQARDGGSIAIPMGVRKHPKMKITKAKKPKALLQKPKHFIADISSTKRAIFRRRRANKRYPLELLFVLDKSPQTIDKRISIQEIVEAVAETRMQSNFNKAMAHAQATAN